LKFAASILASLFLALAPAAAQESYEPSLQRFAAALAAVRDGSADAGAELRESARVLCESHGRCDPRDVAAHYLALDADALAAGRADEARYVELRERVRVAGERGLAGEEWAGERATILRELDALARESEARPDFVPAAQALALAARIEEQQVETDSTLDGTARALVAARATRHARRAIELYARAGQSTPRLEPELCLARLALHRGDDALARASFESLRLRALALRRDDYREHAIAGHLALARAAGDVREERRWLEELARFRSPLESWPLARDWALALLAEDRPQAALEFLARCKPAEGAHAADRLEWQVASGAAALRHGDVAIARRHLAHLDDDPSELAHLARASLALREGDAAGVLVELGEDVRPGFSASGRVQAATLVGEAALELGDRALARRELEFAFEATLAGESDLRARRESELGGSVIGERLGLHSVVLLAETLALDGESLEAVARIEEAHARSLRASARERIDAAALRAWAAHTELGLVTWIIGADRSLAAHVAPDGSAHVERMPLSRAQLLEAVRRVREAALDAHTQSVRFAALAAELGGSLLPGEIGLRLAQLRAQAGPEPRLLVLAHGPLEAAPLEALPWPALGSDAALAVLPGLPERAPGSSALDASTTAWNLLGAPLDSASRPVLPGARGELESLATLHPGSRLSIEAEFTRARVLAACRAAAPLHIATHLDASCESWRSFGPSALRTSDALPLCADELALAGPKLPLVVLSTCWSSSGARVDAEGQLGLARAFLSSGTRNVVVTLWPIEDRSAPRSARLLHEALRAGATPSRAAARTRASLRSAGASPSEWAALRLLGRD
jgi:hypothetical protein